MFFFSFFEGRADFLQLADLLNVTVSEIKDRKSAFHRIAPNCYNSIQSRALRKAVAHK